MLPDPKRPRLLAPGDEASSTPAALSGALSGLARGNYTGRAPAHAPGPAPSRVPARYERGERQLDQVFPAGLPDDRVSPLVYSLISSYAKGSSFAEGTRQLGSVSLTHNSFGEATLRSSADVFDQLQRPASSAAQVGPAFHRSGQQ